MSPALTGAFLSSKRKLCKRINRLSTKGDSLFRCAALGIKNTHIGPSLPAWLTPDLLKKVQDMFSVQTIKTVKEDMKIFDLA
ncbi:MAG: hypothetical protein JXR70_01670 [Spirochaetales bacterium]|nr:hypothetical protein [Spirochaetales bacterium]